MLVLGRKPGERIRIGDDVTITIVQVRGEVVKVGIDAPKAIHVVREELLQKEETYDSDDR